jgi:glutaredoxin
MEKKQKNVSKNMVILDFSALIIGNRRINGYNYATIISALAEGYGWDVLTEEEQKAMLHHFDDYGKPKIVIYSVDWCGYCKKIKKYLVKKGFDYEEFDIETNMVAKQHFDTLDSYGTLLIYVDFRRINGFDIKALDEALELL